MPTPTNAVMDESLLRYARRISHDLNNFSTVLRTYSELLLSELPSDSSTYADVSEIQGAADSMVQYLQRVTRFARASGMRRMPVGVDTGIADAVEAFTRKVPTRSIEAAANTAAYIGADALWWREILAELLQNAHEAAPEGTSIMVRTQAMPGLVVVDVRDRGPGFPTTLANLGEPFVTGKTGLRGAGMGLALVKAFTIAQNGTVSFGRDGEETVVRLELPTVAPQPGS